jgi:hypothetical protein
MRGHLKDKQKSGREKGRELRSVFSLLLFLGLMNLPENKFTSGNTLKTNNFCDQVRINDKRVLAMFKPGSAILREQNLR